MCSYRLPQSEVRGDNENGTSSIIENKEYSSLLDENMARDTSAMIIQAQFRTRNRVEPVLTEMIEFLNSFDVTADGN